MTGAVYIEITATRGSAPRDAGTAMKVTARDTIGTIGGGALEFRAIAAARNILDAGGPERTETVPLGPGLGQCCGGAVTLLYTYQDRATDISKAPVRALTDLQGDPQTLWLWGAGHVGRAVVRACPPGAFATTRVDHAADRFPSRVPAHVTAVPAADMARLAPRAPTDAHHLIFTCSHDVDLALCAALLQRGAASIGLIGSDTKWARFQNRLRASGLDPAPITCPIGDKSLGKTPDAIAKGCIDRLLARTPYGETA
jgi:xanthine dehydrogenase accessory factor